MRLLLLSIAAVGFVLSETNSSEKEKGFIPMVAFKCGYRNQYYHSGGYWVTDPDPHATCLSGKVDVLKYCRRVYPESDVTNIVETPHLQAVEEWCKEEGAPCKWRFWVKAYRCVVGQFESDALLVPEGCHFGHVDQRSVCQDFDHWNETAHAQCSKKSDVDTNAVTETVPATELRSFSVLEPCGLDLFSGVEYVCCPPNSNKAPATTQAPTAAPPQLNMNVKASMTEEKTSSQLHSADDDSWWRSEEESDEDSYEPQSNEWSDEDDDEYYDDEEDDEDSDYEEAEYNGERSEDESYERKPATANTSDLQDGLKDDPYLRQADTSTEHADFKAAMARLQERHKDNVDKVMKEWQELEAHYQEMKSSDPEHAEDYRNDMTARFQKTVAALEEQTRSERRQLDSVHQARVQLNLNERKRKAINKYRASLKDADDSSSHEILTRLETYIRTEEKDRTHSLSHFRHLLRTDRVAAQDERHTLLKRLIAIDERINGTIDMLRGTAKELRAKLEPVAFEFWQSYRRESTPDIVSDELLQLGNAAESNPKILDIYEQDVNDRLDVGTDEWEEDESDSTMGGLLSVKPMIPLPVRETIDGVDIPTIYNPQDVPPVEAAYSKNDPLEFDSVQTQELVQQPASTGSYTPLVLAVGAALLFVAIVVLIVIRRRNSLQAQGFIEVDACSPEEKHVVGMQYNGYENPTYAYFEPPKV